MFCIDRPLSRASLLGARELSRRLSDFLSFLVAALADVLIRLAILTARETSCEGACLLSSPLETRPVFSFSAGNRPRVPGPRSSRGKLSSTWRLQDAVPTKLRRGVVSYTDFSARKSFTRFSRRWTSRRFRVKTKKKRARERDRGSRRASQKYPSGGRGVGCGGRGEERGFWIRRLLIIGARGSTVRAWARRVDLSYKTWHGGTGHRLSF